MSCSAALGTLTAGVAGVVAGVVPVLAACGCRNVITLEKAASSRDMPRLGLGDSLTAGTLAAAREDLAWWQSRLGAWARGEEVGGVGSTMLTRTALEREAVVVATDAGDRGVGAAVMRPVEGAEVEFWAESWPEGGTPPSSTGKELAAVHRFVETHRELVRGRVLAVVSDSMCLVCGLLSGRSRALRGRNLTRDNPVRAGECSRWAWGSRPAIAAAPPRRVPCSACPPSCPGCGRRE